MSSKGLWVSSFGLTLLFVFSSIAQQDTPKPDAAQTDSSTTKKKPAAKTDQKRETVAKPLTEKQKKAKEAALKKELETPWKKWLNEDVAYIITEEERKAFKQFNTDEEREQFVEQFWLRRDPTPDTVENEFKEEHYRRIAYANEHFASGIPGWKTDRGRIYITFGPPDEIDSHPSGGTYERPAAEGGGETSTYPFEDWRYRYIEGIGNDIMIEFVDTTMSGEYHMTMDPSEKDALLYVPNAGLTLAEQMGLSSKTARFQRTDGTHMGSPLGGTPASMQRIHPPRTVRQTAAGAQGQVQGSRSRRRHPDHLQHSADAGSHRLCPRHRFVGPRQHHGSVRKQGPPVPGEGRRAEVGNQPVRPRHHHDAPPGHHFREAARSLRAARHAAEVCCSSDRSIRNRFRSRPAATA